MHVCATSLEAKQNANGSENAILKQVDASPQNALTLLGRPLGALYEIPELITMNSLMDESDATNQMNER